MYSFAERLRPSAAEGAKLDGKAAFLEDLSLPIGDVDSSPCHEDNDDGGSCKTVTLDMSLRLKPISQDRLLEFCGQDAAPSICAVKIKSGIVGAPGEADAAPLPDDEETRRRRVRRSGSDAGACRQSEAERLRRQGNRIFRAAQRAAAVAAAAGRRSGRRTRGSVGGTTSTPEEELAAAAADDASGTTTTAVSEAVVAYQAATQKYTEGIKLSPNNHRLLTNRAACYAALKDWPSCRADGLRAAHLCPEDERAWVYLCKALWKEGSYHQARKKLDAGARHCPASSELLALRLRFAEAMQAEAAAARTSPLPPAVPAQPRRESPAGGRRSPEKKGRGQSGTPPSTRAPSEDAGSNAGVLPRLGCCGAGAADSEQTGGDSFSWRNAAAALRLPSREASPPALQLDEASLRRRRDSRGRRMTSLSRLDVASAAGDDGSAAAPSAGVTSTASISQRPRRQRASPFRSDVGAPQTQQAQQALPTAGDRDGDGDGEGPPEGGPRAPAPGRPRQLARPGRLVALAAFGGA